VVFFFAFPIPNDEINFFVDIPGLPPFLCSPATMNLLIPFAHVLLGGLATVEAADLAGFVRTNVSVLLRFADP
jgi:hypothetical protein